MEVEKYYKYDKVNTTTKNEQKEISSVSYFELYKFSTVFEKLLLLVAVIFCIVSGLFEVLFSLVFGKCVGAIANFGTDLMAAVNETEKLKVEKIFMNEANQFATMAGGIAFIVFFSFYVSTSLFNYTAMRQSFKIRELYFHQVIMQDLSWHDQSPTGDFASRITDDLQKIHEGLNDKASMSIYHITVIVAGVVQSLIIGWQLTLVCLASFPVSFLTMACIGKLSTKLAKDESEVYGEAGKVADETFAYIKTVTAFEGQREETKRYDRFLAIARKNNIRRYFFLGLTNGVTVFFMNVGIALAIWYGVALIMEGKKGNGDYNIAKLVTIYNSIIMSTSNVGAITPFLETFNSAKGAAAKIFSIIEQEPVISKSYETGTKIDQMKGNVEFRTVDFSYPARKQVQVLKNFSLKISAGETVALVGSSGCGKSTIIQLVQRFYDVDQGQIYIDGIEIGNLNLSSLRNRIGLVGQEPVLFDGTIEENIRLGDLSATLSDVVEAAKKSNAHSFILSFPNGYQTVIGERGTQLSGGQKQRIAIARALVRKPALLLLDEATSALDSNSEAVVQATLDKVGKDCTTLIVAHRLSTVRKADRIIVLENGTVVEDGSHDTLMVTKGVYYNLVVSQMSSKEQDSSSHGFELDSSLPDEKFKMHSTNLSKVEKDHKKIVNFTTVWKILMSNLSPKWCIVVGVISSIIFGIALIFCMLVLGRSLAIMSGTDEKYVVSQVNMYAVQFIILGIVLGVSSIVQAYFIGIAGENLTLSLRSSMFNSIIHQEIGWFDKTENGVGSLGARLAGEPSNVQNAIGLCTGPFLNVITMTLLLLGVGFYMSWKLLLGFFGFLPFLVIMLYLEQKVLVRENLKSMEVLEQSTKLAVEAISNIRTVASLAIEKNFHVRYMTKLKTYRRLTIRNIHMQGIVYGLSKGSLSLSYIITIFYGAYLIKNNETDAATVIGLTEVFATSIGNLTYTLVFLSNLTKGFVACNLIYELLNRIPKIKNVARSPSEEAIEGDVEYKSVSFSYPTRPDVKIFENLNLVVLKGTTVALVGPSGCGKSTIVQLLLRFYDVDCGQVTFGEEDIAELNLGLLRLRLGIVMQEPNLFSRTIGENIAYGNLGSEVSGAEIIEAAKKANIHSFISSLPLGYDTFLGEKDTQLSGGQKQRIAIARALVRNPEILLLDEATSALDAESEKVVQEALNNAREERTCIVIAHRLKTIEDADVIAVLNEGKISEKGTHQELMSMKGLYWKLYNLQLSST